MTQEVNFVPFKTEGGNTAFVNPHLVTCVMQMANCPGQCVIWSVGDTEGVGVMEHADAVTRALREATIEEKA